jgi:DICT domain-containing protein
LAVHWAEPWGTLTACRKAARSADDSEQRLAGVWACEMAGMMVAKLALRMADQKAERLVGKMVAL